jgi:hypothetical protein
MACIRFLFSLSAVILFSHTSYALDAESKEAVIQTIGGYICQGATDWVQCTSDGKSGCPTLARAVLEECLKAHESIIDNLKKPEETADLSIKLTWCVHNQIKKRFKFTEEGACAALPPHLSDK